MARKFNSNGIADGTLPGTKISSGTISASLVGSVRISSISITDNSYVVLDDTAVILTGGYIKIIGTGFVSGCSVAIDTTIATSVSFVSATQLNVQVPAKAAGTYNIYLTTPTGAVAIRVNAITYSSTPTWTSTSPLPGGVNNTAISIQLGATSDSTVSYTVQAGSTLPTGLTLSSGGLLSGTVTGLVLETTYNFTVVATDVELQDSPKAFSITIIVSDPYFKSTVLLLQGDLTPFTADASTNKFELSAVGTPSANINNPLQPGYYSGYFNGSTDYLSIAANSIYDFGSSNFTAECWIYPIAFNAIGGSFIGVGHQSGSASWYLGGDSTGAVGCSFWSSGTTVGGTMTSAAGVIAFNRWNHVAVTRNGNTWNIWSNGTSVATMINATAIGNEGRPFNIAYDYGSGAARLQNCYMSNVRIVKGTAVYTGNFTPPTAPLAATQSAGTNIAAITGTATSLLTCQSNRFIDNSSTPQTITVSGTPSISVAQPFTLPSPYTGYGSGLFNGSSYVSAPTNATKYQFLQSGTYTLEAWVYFTNPASATEGVITTGPVGTMKIYLSKGGGGITNGIDSDASVGYTVTHYEWIHLAIVFSAGILKLYKNGVLANSTSYPWNISGTDFIVGRLYTDLSQYQLNGYVASARAVKGVSVYTGAFTPPTLAPLTNAGATSAAAYPSTTNVNTTFASSETSILTLQTNQAQNNNQFRDSSTNNFAITRTGTPTQGTFTPFSQTGWSVYLPPQQYVTTPANSTFDITAVDFTVEFWVYFTAYNTMGSSGMTVIGNLQSSTGWLCGLNGIGGLTGLSFNTYSAGALVSNLTATGITSTNLPLNSWHHIAFVRSGSNFYFFLDGVSYNATSAPTAVGAGGQLAIGVYHQNMTYSGNPSWYLSNMRIVKGVAVYTGNFTPPTAPLTATQSVSGNIAAITGTATSLLTFNRNRFIDTIATPNIFTAPGSLTSIQSFSPFAPSAAYSATLVGGSMYFNGTTDYLMVPSNSALDLTSGDFTIEGWIYPTAAGQFLNKDGAYSVAYPQYALSISGGNKLQLDAGAGNQANTASTTYFGTTNITYNNWHHFAAVRTGTTIKLFLDGNQEVSTAQGQGMVSGGRTLDIALNRSSSFTYLKIYISNLRIVKGTAVYTAAFTPPTAPLTAIAGTSLLLSATNAGIFDATSKNDIIVVNDARVSTSKQKYGSGAMYFDGTGDYLSMLAAPNLYFGAGDFTIEAWIWKSANGTGSGGYDGIFQLGVSGSVTDGCVLEASSARGYYFTMGGGWSLQYNVSPNDSTWHHVAVSRSGNNTRLFVDGVQQAIYTSAYTIPSTATYALVGAEAGASYPFNGYIDDLRITKGVGRYTTTFTPPSQAMLGM